MALERDRPRDLPRAAGGGPRRGPLPRARVRGYVEGTGIGPYEGAHVRVEPSGNVFVATGLTSQGQGHHTTFAQIVAEALGCDPSTSPSITGDTSSFNWGAGTYASRALVTGGNAIHIAAPEVRDKALRLAAASAGGIASRSRAGGRRGAGEGRPRQRR